MMSRFLDGVEEAADAAALTVVLDAGAMADVPGRVLNLTADGECTALFGITGVRKCCSRWRRQARSRTRPSNSSH